LKEIQKKENEVEKQEKNIINYTNEIKTERENNKEEQENALKSFWNKFVNYVKGIDFKGIDYKKIPEETKDMVDTIKTVAKTVSEIIDAIKKFFSGGDE